VQQDVLAENPSSPGSTADAQKPTTRTVQVLKLHRPDEEGGEGIPLVAYSAPTKKKNGGRARRRKFGHGASNGNGAGAGNGMEVGNGSSGNVMSSNGGDEEKKENGGA